MNIVRPAPGKSLQDVLASLEKGPVGTPPYLIEGGMTPMSPGMTGWMRLNLQPGQYVAACFVIDPATGEFHSMFGMVYPFTIQA